MRVISYKPILDFSTRHPDARGPLDRWFEKVENAQWASIRDVRLLFAHADAVVATSGRTVVVFNIGGNKYRLIAAIHYDRRRVFLLKIMTHSEYSDSSWKDVL